MNATVKPRVLHVTRDLEQGGAQEVLCVLAESRARGERFFVCTLADGPLRGRLEDAGAECFVIAEPRCRFSHPIAYRAELRRIARALADLVEARQIELVQTHLLTVLDAVVLRLRRAPCGPAIVWTFHGTDFLPLRPGLTLPLRRLACRRMYRANARRVDAIIAVSEGVRDSVIRQLGPAAAKTRVVHNALSRRRLQATRDGEAVRVSLGLEPHAPVVLFVGRLAEEKGCRTLVEAIPAVLSRVPAALFLLAGDGPDLERLEAQARRAGVADHVRLLGTRGDVGDLLGCAEVFCLPSLREGRSLSLLEAMAAGRAVVATDIAENRAVLGTGPTALLVPPRDAAALADGLAALLSEPQRGREMGAAAQRRFLSLQTPERQAAEYSALYRELWSARARR